MSEEEIEKKRDQEIEDLQKQLNELQLAKQELENTVAAVVQSIQQIEVQLQEESSKTPNLETEYKLKKRTMDLLPNAEENIQQLQQISSVTSSKLFELAAEWENHRAPLLEAYRQLKDKLTNTSEEAKGKLEKIKSMRLEMRQIADEVRAKEQKYQELLETYGSLPKDVHRGNYTDRILDIVKNVKKQKVDIDKVLLDTRSISKEINMVSDTLNRTFSVIDELIYQDATANGAKEPASKEAYKQLVAMNDVTFSTYSQIYRHLKN
jgi:chromosome segregation ATPase